MTRTTQTQPHPRPPIAYGTLTLALTLFTAFLILERGTASLADADHALAQWIVEHRSEALTTAALVLNWAGAGIPAVVLTAAITIALLATRGWRAGSYFALASVISTALVELFKNIYARPRPPDGLIEAGFGSYPSGHSARAAVIAVALCIILPRVWTWLTGTIIVLAMMASRVILEVHWPTDTVGGALLGASVATALAAVMPRDRKDVGARRLD